MKYFVVSDIHSFARELKQGLRQAGYCKTNKDHCLIICGDIFDRGESALDVYNYIHSIPKSRRILIRGNHELLYFDLLDKKYPESHDFHNCTVDTFCQIADMEYLEDSYDITTASYLEAGYRFYSGTFYDTEKIDPDCQELWNTIKEKVKNHPITKWLKSKEWKNYYELDKYIFVHSFIPLEDTSNMPMYYLNGHSYQYVENWRETVNDYYWKDAMWGCPWKKFEDGLFKEEAKKGKVLVVGHWHTFDFFNHLKNIYDKRYDGLLYYSKHLIGLDGGVHYNYFDNSYGNYTHHQNVLIIDENFDCIDKFGDKLKEEKIITKFDSRSVK